MTVTQETQEKINELQIAEQALQSYLQQKQNFQAQKMEVESALTELEGTSSAYRIVGNIMVKNSKEDIKKDLESKKELIDIRLKSIQKQEDALKEKTKTIQEEVLKKMGKK